MAGFISFAAESSSVMPDSAYHARAAREARDGDYAFTARAFPALYNQADVRPMRLDQLTQSDLNDRHAQSADGATVDDARGAGGSSSSATAASSSSSSSSAAPAARRGGGGLELTMHESHGGHLIGSVVWDGGKALAWVLEAMHTRVRDLAPDGSGFVDAQQATPSVTTPRPSAPSFTSPALLEYLRAKSDGCCFDIPRDFLVGSRVLELGAGTGITGLACVKLGASEVCITDILELVPLMKENVRRNCPGTLKEEWTERERVSAQTPTADAALPDASSSTAASHVAASSSSSAASSSSKPPSSPLDDVPLSSLYLTCTNCDDLCELAFECRECDATLCEVCDAAFHRPASKAKHERAELGLSAATAAANTAAIASSVVPARPLPPTCDVYVEELLWGVHASIDTLPPSLRAPFDVIIMADVVYDAYSTTGVGSEGCDTFRRLFHTLCLLATPETTVLMTYTPRRAPEQLFFDMLATEFVWEAYPACQLLPHHESIDERIWIYHLHRTPLARKLNAARKLYLHEGFGGEIAREREKQRDEANRRAEEMKRRQQQPQSASSSSSSSSSACCAAEECKQAPPAAASPADPASRAPSSVVQNITPSMTRFLAAEEAKQARDLREKLERRATRASVTSL